MILLAGFRVGFGPITSRESLWLVIHLAWAKHSDFLDVFFH